ncbi:MAG TPA: putative baseplate assembly protein, partial [Allocoleopsis sp.]
TTQPGDLTIRQLWVHPTNNHLFAATSQAGLFRSVDYGDRWAAINTGLTSLDTQLNPTGMVNTDFRAITLFQQDQQTQLVAGGIGMLISPDNLYTAPIRAGDRLQIMAPPQPLLPRDPESIPTQAEKTLEQKWLLQNQDGFIGVVMTPTPQDITLKPATDDDEIVSEIGEVLLPPSDQQQPILTLTEPLQNSYDPATVQIHANVVPATHGETVTEVLGSGDSSQDHQRFGLKKPPLTYVSAPTVSGAASTLQVRVNQVLWQEVPSLYLRSPQEQVYLTRDADDGAVTLIFGDGKSGMRLPTGMENVTASYRSGIGLSGQVGANRLSLLKIRPLGISQVTNPLPATGAADPETMTEARTSAPLTVRTLGRIVSLQDYEDFARSFAGIGKAQATVISTGNTQSVHITVAAIGGEAVLPTTALYENLMLAIANAHDPMQLVQVESYEKLLFNLEASLLIDGRYKLDRVLLQVRQAVERRFAFEHRNFGQAVTAAEVIA